VLLLHHGKWRCVNYASTKVF